MRLFAALDPPAAARECLAAMLPRDDRLRFVPQDQWHITLAFYGEVPASVLDGLSGHLAHAAGCTPPLRLSLAAAGTFPSRASRARVLWCGLSGELAPLALMAERVAMAGRHAGIVLEERPFRAHLTLARCRRGSVDLRDTVATLSRFASPAWTVERLLLVRSHLGALRRHEELCSWPRGTADAATATRVPTT